MSVFERQTLGNELRVLTAPLSHAQSVACFVMLAAGSRYERAENRGIAHFAEHMFFKGTERRPTSRDLTTLIDTTLGAGVSVPHSYLEGCEARDGATIGPFAYLRPAALLREEAKAGAFVEIKNSDIGARTKVPHLSYIGDADVGEESNLGASTITANYDGRRKHRTTIGSRVHTSVDTTFVAPVAIGDDAYTGAGSVITDDVPRGALGIARERQTNIEGYAQRKRDR